MTLPPISISTCGSCCSTVTDPCDVCTGSSCPCTDGATSVGINLGGITNNTCGSCGELNANHTGNGSSCFWTVNPTGFTCDVSQISAQVDRVSVPSGDSCECQIVLSVDIYMNNFAEVLSAYQVIASSTDEAVEDMDCSGTYSSFTISSDTVVLCDLSGITISVVI